MELEASKKWIESYGIPVVLSFLAGALLGYTVFQSGQKNNFEGMLERKEAEFKNEEGRLEGKIRELKSEIETLKDEKPEKEEARSERWIFMGRADGKYPGASFVELKKTDWEQVPDLETDSHSGKVITDIPIRIKPDTSSEPIGKYYYERNNGNGRRVDLVDLSFNKLSSGNRNLYEVYGRLSDSGEPWLK